MHIAQKIHKIKQSVMSFVLYQGTISKCLKINLTNWCDGSHTASRSNRDGASVLEECFITHMQSHLNVEVY